jgi:hypothetical protein
MSTVSGTTANANEKETAFALSQFSELNGKAFDGIQVDGLGDACGFFEISFSMHSS